MTITEDKVIFETADFDGLSDFAKKAATAYLEDYAKHFSNIVNRDLVNAKEYLKVLAKADPKVESILTGLASADEAKLLEAQPLLEQLNDLLNS